ncbi:12454_t:CDS:2 [Ambispora gerdemannii]|uniref:12454_t:CDS:1 n=1 Tax=Ambispora gerdemannii TaxID=144530 RepID=A0A9N9FS05_9GLOM|nr:12454_t:CDS:2 [Ambispora gerdemannii]
MDYRNYRNTEAIAIFVVAMVGIGSSLIGSHFVLYRTLLKWRKCLEKSVTLPMNYRLPLYTALTDIFISTLHIANFMYLIINHRVIRDPACQIVAIAQDVSYGYNKFLYMIIAIATYLEVARRIPVNFGPYDYRLFLMMNVLTFLNVFPKVMLTNYGRHNYWCSEDSIFVGILSVSISVGIPITTAIICFMCIRFSLAKRSFARLNNADLIGDRMVKTEEEIIIRKIPMIVFTIWVWFHQNRKTQTWSYVLLMIGFSCGGIGNAINFVLNERLKTTEVKISDPDFSLDILHAAHTSPIKITIGHPANTSNLLEFNQDIAGFPTNLR